MSAQTDKAAFVVARFTAAGRLTSSLFFRADERTQAEAFAATLAENGVAHRLSEVAR